MPPSLNLYGDISSPTSGNHGPNISLQRIDDLDSASFSYALNRSSEEVSAVDLGCGAGVQGLRFASLGVTTLLVDRIPVASTLAGCGGIDRFLPLTYLRKDARFLKSADLPSNLAICHSQRFIQYLKHDEATQLLRTIREACIPSAKMFLSAGGLRSELGRGYEAVSSPVNERYGTLSPEMANKHGIFAPVCLYYPEELVALCVTAGFKCEKAFESPFGNIKGVFVCK